MVRAATARNAGAFASCQEKARLVGEFQVCTELYADNVRELTYHIGTISKDRYFKVKETSEFARLHCEEARMALERHTGKHGC